MKIIFTSYSPHLYFDIINNMF